jgi:phosphodiesterase/alkaline phosphatase D-like protein
MNPFSHPAMHRRALAPFSRQALLALGLAALLLPGCRDLLVQPAPPAPVPVSVLFSLSGHAAGATVAYDRANRVRVRLVHSDGVAVETERTFEPAGPETEVFLTVEPKQQNERVQLFVELLIESDLLFRGSSEVVLQSGVTNDARVSLDPVAARVVLPQQIPVMTSLGDTLVLQGAVVFTTGDTIPALTPSWSAADASVVEVTSQGRVVSRSEGEARLVATHAGLSAEAVVRVDAAVESVQVLPAALTLLVGETRQLTAVARDRRGNSLARNVEAWISASPLVADVAGTGVVTARAVGTSDITASVAGRSGVASVGVEVLPPEAVSGSASGVAAQAATLNGSVNGRGTATEAWFEWGNTPELGQTTPRQTLTPSGAAQAVTAAVGGLTPNTAYFFRVAAGNAGGTTRGEVETFTTPDVPPTAPSNLTAGAELLTIHLSWADNSGNEQGFRIERRPEGSSDWQEIAVVGANVTSFVDAGLALTTRYFYRVRAFNQVGASAYSDEAQAVTPGAPLSITDSPSNVTPSSATLHGSVNPRGALTRAWFEWGTTAQLGNQTPPQTIQGGLPAQGINVVVSGLSPNTPFHFRVVAENGVGTTHGQIRTFTTPDVPPAAPSNLAATAVSASQINLVWTDNSSNELGFRIELCTGAQCSNFAQIDSVAANVTSFQNTGLAPNTSYRYRVRAFNSAGASAYSNIAAATTTQVPPAAPSHLTAAATGTSIRLTWRDNSDNEDGFNVYRRYQREGYIDPDWILQEHLRPGPNDTTIVDPDKEVGATYHYRITAYNAAGESAPSNEAQATVVAAPSATTSSATGVTASSATLNGSVNPNAAATSVWFEWGTTAQLGNETPPQAIGSGSSAVEVSANLTTLNPGATYHFRIAAQNSAGTTRGGTLTFTTSAVPPAAPSNLIATAVSASQINLAWQDNSNNELGFHIERCTGAQCSNFVQIDSVGANVTSFQSTGLTASTTYRYRVRAFNAGGTSAASNEAQASTPPSPPFPLWVNGQLVTHPNGGLGPIAGQHVSMADPVHNADGSNVLLDAQGPQFRIADDFTVSAGGWTLTQVTVHAFQTGAAQPTWTGANLYIRRGSVTGPIVASTTTTTWELTGVYRTFNGVLNDASRRIFQVIFTLPNVNLAPDTYWIDWQVEGGSSASAPYVTLPPDPPGGNNTRTVFQNGQQMTVGGVWQPTLAAPGAEVSFVIHGVGQPARASAP